MVVHQGLFSFPHELEGVGPVVVGQAERWVDTDRRLLVLCFLQESTKNILQNLACPVGIYVVLGLILSNKNIPYRTAC